MTRLISHYFVSIGVVVLGRGTSPSTKGTAYVIYEDIYDAKSACESLSGFNLMGRYLIVLYYQVHKINKKSDLRRKEREDEALKAK